MFLFDFIFNANTYWGVALIFVNFFSILLLYRLFGKLGLFVHIPIAMIVANLQVVKTVEIFGYVTALGNAMFGGTFLVSDILSELYGEKEARKSVFIGFYALICLSVFMALAIAFTPHSSDQAQPSLVFIFSQTPRFMLAGFCSFLAGQLHDVWAYAFWKKRFPELRFLFLRNNLSTLISQMIDTSIFTYIAFGLCLDFMGWQQVYPADVIWEIGLTAYVLKFVIAALDTPFLYWAVRIHARYWKGREG